MKTILAAWVVAMLSAVVQGFWRMDCHSRSGLERMDPLMSPGNISYHAHAIHGGSNFGLNTETSDLLASECTSCLVAQDRSAYWTPAMYFIHANGTTEVVPQIGGMLAYYFLFPDSNTSNVQGQTVKAFPSNFKMIAGDVTLRNYSSGPVPDKPKSEWDASDKTQFALSQKAIGFNCLNYNPGATTEGSLERHSMPNKTFLDANCLNGIRAELMFPSCWNGKDLDSPHFKSHVAYPDLVMTGACPSGFETKLVSLFYETIWDTYHFVGVDGEFVFSYGDPTGSGYHGDFIMGWDQDFLQSAVQTCTNPSGQITDCPLFNVTSQAEAATCSFAVPDTIKADVVSGPAMGLPGNVALQTGPAPATIPTAAPPCSPDVTYNLASPTSAATSPAGTALQPPPSSASPLPATAQPSATSPQAYGQAPTSSISSTTVTSAPVASAPAAGDAVTTTFTSNGVVYHEVINQVNVGVTVTAQARSAMPAMSTAPAPAPAHVRRHHAAHPRHGHGRHARPWSG